MNILVLLYQYKDKKIYPYSLIFYSVWRHGYKFFILFACSAYFLSWAYFCLWTSELIFSHATYDVKNPSLTCNTFIYIGLIHGGVEIVTAFHTCIWNSNLIQSLLTYLASRFQYIRLQLGASVVLCQKRCSPLVRVTYLYLQKHQGWCVRDHEIES